MALVSAGMLAQACSKEASTSHISSLGQRQTAQLQVFTESLRSGRDSKRLIFYHVQSPVLIERIPFSLNLIASI